MSLLTIEEQDGARPGAAGIRALLALGFRPFYLLAAAFAAVSIPAWIASYYGLAGRWQVGLTWHIHEMLFGFVIAVIIGFMYTAGRNWTGLWTPRGATLASIAGLWLAGRVAMFAADPLLAAIVDFSFLPVAAWPMYRVLQRSGNKRNMVLILLLGLLAAANAAFHAAVLGWIDIAPARPIYAAIMIVVVIEAVIGGRVIPNFTAGTVKGVSPVMHATADKLTFALTGAAGAAWVFAVPAPLGAALALVTAATQAKRLAGWKPLSTLRHPLLWVLHLSYAWIPLGFLLLALAELHLLPVSAAVHVLAVGALAGLIVGMMTRTALGHTGRPLKAGTAETAMYLLMQVGVLARLVAALTHGGARDAGLWTAAACWSTAFVVYLVVYAPYLVRPRVDGREG